MRFPVKIYPQAQKRRGFTTLTLLWRLMDALGLAPGKPAMAVVSPGVVIFCQAEQAEMFECILRDFPGAFISEAEAPPQKVSGPGGAGCENGVQER